MRSAIKCESCGAESIYESGDVSIKCEFCGGLIDVHRNTGSNSDKGSVDKSIFDQIQLNQRLKNYKECIRYCDAALENNPKDEKTLRIKVECLYKLLNKDSGIKNLLDLKHSLERLSISIKVHYDIKALNKLIENVHSSLVKVYNSMEYDYSRSGKIWDSYSERSIEKIITILKTLECCYELCSNDEYLKNVINELSGHGKLIWLKYEGNDILNQEWVLDFDFNAEKTLSRLNEKIKSRNPNYVPPEINLNIVSNVETDSKCFVATVCYENPNHPSLNTLRRYRDEVLIKYYMGRNFIHFYYKHGPKAAASIEDYPLLKILILNIILRPMVYLIKFYFKLSKNKIKN